MTVWDWLATPSGQEVIHVLVLLVAAITACLSAWAGRLAHRNGKLMNGHLQQHLRRAELDRNPPEPINR